MTRAVLAVDLKDDPAVVAAYVDHHQRAWPEVIASLRGVGIRQLDIYLLGLRLVMIVETDGRDLREAFAAHMAVGGRVARWEALMKSMQQPPPGAEPGDWWTHMRPVFRLEDARSSTGSHASAD
jgi:L-rhamnose mutarotase